MLFLILSSETLLLYFASRTLPQYCMLHVGWKVKFSFGRGGGGGGGLGPLFLNFLDPPLRTAFSETKRNVRDIEVYIRWAESASSIQMKSTMFYLSFFFWNIPHISKVATNTMLILSIRVYLKPLPFSLINGHNWLHPIQNNLCNWIRKLWYPL